MIDTTSQLMIDNARSIAFGGMPKVSKNANEDAIRKTAIEFEAVFATQMLEPMFEEISQDGMFGGGHAEGIYQSLMVQEFGAIIAKRGSLGIADIVSREMLKIQEAQSLAKPERIPS